MKISIITPSFNQGKFIERTIRSVIEQKCNFDLEYIIVDGKSTDNSVEIIRKYANLDKRIRWISEPDNGQSAAINKGLRMATGAVVAYLNSDDYYLDGALETVRSFFANNNRVHWLTGYCRVVDSQDKEIRRWVTLYKNFMLRHFSYKQLLILNAISQPATFWRRSVLDNIGYFDEKEHLVMDYEYWCRAGQKYRLAVVPKFLAAFRLHRQNKSSIKFKEQFLRESAIANQFTSSFTIKLLHRLHARIVCIAYSSIVY